MPDSRRDYNTTQQLWVRSSRFHHDVSKEFSETTVRLLGEIHGVVAFVIFCRRRG